ncbi:hypothetical protein ES288_D01G129100v1, partial [Gossypium darwinii]
TETKSLTLSIVLCGCDFLHFFSISKIDRVFQYRSTSTVKTSTDPPPVGLLQFSFNFFLLKLHTLHLGHPFAEC